MLRSEPIQPIPVVTKNDSGDPASNRRSFQHSLGHNQAPSSPNVPKTPYNRVFAKIAIINPFLGTTN